MCMADHQATHLESEGVHAPLESVPRRAPPVPSRPAREHRPDKPFGIPTTLAPIVELDLHRATHHTVTWKTGHDLG